MNTPFILVIFGATGDLMRRKLLPALFKLHKEKKLPEKFYIIGFARRNFTDGEFRNFLKEHFHFNDIYHYSGDWEDFSGHLFYQQGLFEERQGFKELISRLKKIDEEIGACVARFFYLATPPGNYETILDNIVTTKLNESCGPESDKLTKIVIEKPFGKDLETARALDKKLGEIFKEEQIFRADHYLSKETVQNILTFRFANGIFEPIWNRNYIDHVQITWAEKKGIEGRGEFFDGVGLLRNVGQNHLMQLIAAVAMEQPKHFSKEPIRDARASAIAAIRPIRHQEIAKCVVRGQYTGYRREKEVSPRSLTETFVAMRLFVDTPRFKGVPFYLRAGERMPQNLVSISLVFKQTCHILFKEYGCPEEGNILTIGIQPDEEISLRVIAKKPGAKLNLGTVNMKFSYQEEFGEKGGEAYEKVLLDILAGDQMLFNRSDELGSSWEFITKILQGWSRGARSGSAREKKKLGVLTYKPGTWGPKEAEELIEKDGRKWI